MTHSFIHLLGIIVKEVVSGVNVTLWWVLFRHLVLWYNGFGFLHQRLLLAKLLFNHIRAP